MGTQEHEKGGGKKNHVPYFPSAGSFLIDFPTIPNSIIPSDFPTGGSLFLPSNI